MLIKPFVFAAYQAAKTKNATESFPTTAGLVAKTMVDVRQAVLANSTVSMVESWMEPATRMEPVMSETKHVHHHVSRLLQRNAP